MLNEHLISLIQAVSTSIWSGSCSPDLETEIIRLSAAQVWNDKTHMDLFVPQRYSESYLRNVEKNPKISFVFSAVPSFETYQVKGQYVSKRQSTKEETSIQRAYVQGFGQAMVDIGLRYGYRFEQYYEEPSLVICFKAEEIYEQTPKKGTGNRIS